MDHAEAKSMLQIADFGVSNEFEGRDAMLTNTAGS